MDSLFVRTTAVSLLGLAVLIGGGAWLTYSDTSPSTETEPREIQKQAEAGSGGPQSLQQAPEFSLSDYSGNTVTLDGISAPVTVINIWASWCPFCTKELPAFAKLQETFPRKVEVLAINRGESRKTAKGFTDKADLTDKLTFLLDPDESYYRKIGGFSMPETLFLNADKAIVRHQRGPLTFQQMKAIVAGITADKETGTSTTLNATSSSDSCIAGTCNPDNTHEG